MQIVDLKVPTHEGMATCRVRDSQGKKITIFLIKKKLNQNFFYLFFSECSEATQTCLPEEVSFQVRSPELKST